MVASIYTGIAQGMQPIVSSAYGRGNISSVKLALKYAVVTMLAVSVLVYTCISIFAGPITGIFNSGNNGLLQSIAEQGLKIYFTAVPFMGLNIVISMFFIAVEKAIDRFPRCQDYDKRRTLNYIPEKKQQNVYRVRQHSPYFQKNVYYRLYQYYFLLYFHFP